MSSEDGFGLALSTASADARDAYISASTLLLTYYPGAAAAFDQAIAADPDFALAYVGKARALQLDGETDAIGATLAAAEAASQGVTDREASHIGVFRHVLAGEPEAALAAVRAHLRCWPRDAMVLGTSGNQTGLIGLSGRVGRERELAEFLDELAPHYPEDPWFEAHHAMALSENGQAEAAAPIIEHAMACNPRNGYGAHTMSHVQYERGETDAAMAFLNAWLADYTPDGGFHGHLHWHLAMVELERGETDRAFARYSSALMHQPYAGPPAFQVMDAAAFLWRAEIAGHPRDAGRWETLRALARIACPRPGLAFFDWHVALVQAACGDGAALEARAREIEDLIQAGRYPAGPVLPALTRAFACFQRQDFDTTIALLAPILPERERIGGSRAQMDLLELTLCKAYLATGRSAELGDLLAARRTGPNALPMSAR